MRNRIDQFGSVTGDPSPSTGSMRKGTRVEQAYNPPDRSTTYVPLGVSQSAKGNLSTMEMEMGIRYACAPRRLRPIRAKVDAHGRPHVRRQKSIHRARNPARREVRDRCGDFRIRMEAIPKPRRP